MGSGPATPMVELLEYCLVFAVSMLFVAGSVATYAAFSGSAGALEFRLAASSVSKLATEAATNGSATGSVEVPASTLSCKDGTLTLASGSLSSAVQVAAGCDFLLNVTAGLRTFRFSFGGGLLAASVV